MFDFTCPSCGFTRALHDRLRGRKWRCPSCKAKIKHRGGDRFQIREAGVPFEASVDEEPEESLDSSPIPVQTAAPDQRTGTLLGHYRLIGLLGSGSSGHVYLAEHETLKRKAAVKILAQSLAPSSDRAARLAQEAVALAKVDHPNVVNVYDSGTENGTPYLAMKLVDGPSLSEALKGEGTFPSDRVLRLARELLAGLDAIHQAGLLHRDIKPGNVLLTKSGEALLADFGLAWEVPPPSTTPSTTFSGTADYAAPELALGQPPDVRSDLYALGGTLYRAVTGRPPFGGRSTSEKLKKQIYEPLTPAKAFNPQLDPGLELLLDKLLRKEREDRPSSAKEAALLIAPPTPSAPPPVEPAKSTPRMVAVRTETTPLIPVFVASGALLAVLVVIVMLNQRPPAAPPPAPAPTVRPAAPPPAVPKVDTAEQAALERLQRVIASEPPAAAIQACADFLDKYPNSRHIESVLLKKMELHQEVDRQTRKPAAPMWTFKLRTGGQIQAPEYEDLPDGYLVKVAGTSIKIPKENVVEIQKGE